MTFKHMALRSYQNKKLSAFLIVLMLVSSVLSAGHVHDIEHHHDHDDLAHFGTIGGCFDLGSPAFRHGDHSEHHQTHADSAHMETSADHYDNCLAYHVADHQQPVYSPSFDFGVKLIAIHQTGSLTATAHYQQRIPPARAPPVAI